MLNMTIETNAKVDKWIKRSRVARALGLTSLWRFCLRQAIKNDPDLQQKIRDQKL